MGPRRAGANLLVQMVARQKKPAKKKTAGKAGDTTPPTTPKSTGAETPKKEATKMGKASKVKAPPKGKKAAKEKAPKATAQPTKATTQPTKAAAQPTKAAEPVLATPAEVQPAEAMAETPLDQEATGAAAAAAATAGASGGASGAGEAACGGGSLLAAALRKRDGVAAPTGAPESGVAAKGPEEDAGPPPGGEAPIPSAAELEDPDVAAARLSLTEAFRGATKGMFGSSLTKDLMLRVGANDPHVTELDMSDGPLNEEMCKWMPPRQDAALQLLQYNRHVSKVSLNGCQLGDSSAIVLGDVCRANHTLTSLSVERNDLREEVW